MNWRGLLVTIVVVEHKAKLISSGMGSRILVTSEKNGLMLHRFSTHFCDNIYYTKCLGY